MTERKAIDQMQLIISLFSGACAGAISRTLTAPTDRVKTLMQTGRGVPLRPPNMSKKELHQKFATLNSKDGMMQACIEIYKEGGWIGFWRGNGINVLKVIPDEALKYAIKRYVTALFSGDPDRATLSQHIVAGAACGAITQIFTYPLEVLKTRMTVASQGEWKSIADCFVYTKNQGWHTFYSGFIPNIAGIIPFQGTYFGLFFYLTGKYEEEHSGHKPPPSLQIQYSLFASTLAVFVAYPFNLVRTKLQIQGVNKRAVLYKGTADCLIQTVHHEGYKGLYRGLMPNYLKALPSLSISLVLVKSISDGLNNLLNKT